MYTSAGEAPPSCMIWAARTAESFVRILTLIPVFFSNAATSKLVSSACWPLYSVIDECAELPPQPLTIAAQHAASATSAPPRSSDVARLRVTRPVGIHRYRPGDDDADDLAGVRDGEVEGTGRERGVRVVAES